MTSRWLALLPLALAATAHAQQWTGLDASQLHALGSRVANVYGDAL